MWLSDVDEIEMECCLVVWIFFYFEFFHYWNVCSLFLFSLGIPDSSTYMYTHVRIVLVQQDTDELWWLFGFFQRHVF